MSVIYCPLTNGNIDYKTCATCVDMLCEEHIVSNRKIKAQKKKKKKQINGDTNENNES